MRIYARAGRRQRALAQFHLLRESLRRDFEDEPDDETRRLYQKILTRTPDAEDAPEWAAPTRRVDRPPRGRGNLPLHLTSFVGRERERREVAGLARRYRLVTLTGPGGSGKTRLVQEVATELIGDADDGVWLVELGGSPAPRWYPTWLGRCWASRAGRPDPRRRLWRAHVGGRRMLLVLDNCEHLIGACAAPGRAPAARVPGPRVLATSREPLRVPGEDAWRVPPLAPPAAARCLPTRDGASTHFEL